MYIAACKRRKRRFLGQQSVLIGSLNKELFFQLIRSKVTLFGHSVSFFLELVKRFAVYTTVFEAEQDTLALAMLMLMLMPIYLFSKHGVHGHNSGSRCDHSGQLDCNSTDLVVQELR